MKIGRLKEALSYSPDTGEFLWRVSGSRRISAGDVAGGVDNYGYRRIRIDGKNYQAHRLAWLYVHGDWPKHQIDHINGAKDDNRIGNLRDVSQVENCRNRRLCSRNASGVFGVSFIAANKKWRAMIGVGGKDIFLGYFPSKFDAIAARKSAEIKHNYHENHGAQL